MPFLKEEKGRSPIELLENQATKTHNDLSPQTILPEG